MAIKAFVALTALAGFGCSSAPETPQQPAQPAEPAARRPSVVLVTMDTTRADRIGCYGHEAAHTPNMDALAAQGWRFDKAYTPVPLTTPAHATILSGLYPTRHGIHTNGDAVLPDEVVTVAEHLADAGYSTAASLASFTTSRIWNLDQGFEAYFDDLRANTGPGGRWSQERPATQVVDDAIGWLDGVQGGPFFLWAHFFDPHDPYRPPPAWAERFPEDPYDGEIAYMDEQIGRLMQAVEARGEPVIWVLVGDHGESLDMEHEERGHGLWIFDPTMRVPFIIRPAEPASSGAVVEQAVTNADLLPTLLGMLGLPSPHPLDGLDLSPLMQGQALERPGVYLEAYTALHRFGYHPELGFTDGAYKLIDTPTPRLFDLSADPGELGNLLPGLDAPVASLREGLQATLRGERVGEAATPAPETSAQLAALGYMEGSFDLDPEQLPEIDAKDRVGVITELERVRYESMDPSKAAQAIAAYERIIAQEPQLVEASLGLARLLGRSGARDRAQGVLRAALDRDPSSTVLASNLAHSLAADGDYEGGLALMEGILEQVPRDDIGRIGVLRMLSDLDREQEALARAQVWLAEDPEDPALLAHAGVLMAQLERLAEAEPMLLASLSDNVPRQLVHRTLGLIYMDRQEPGRAIPYLRAELEYFPNDKVDLRVTLADALGRVGAWEEAAAEYRSLAELQPEHPLWRHNWAQAVFNTEDYERAEEILAPLAGAPEPLAESLLLQANILAKTGRRDEGQALFERAQELKEAQAL
jgi:arylsulfatase A-like enzyme/predicted Zn-dependent protease